MIKAIITASLATTISLSLQGCASLDIFTNIHKPGINKEKLLAHDRPPIDRLLVPNPRDGFAENPNQPIMTMPPRPNAGLVGELAPKHKVETRKAPHPSIISGQEVEFSFLDANLKSILELLFDQYIRVPYTFLPDFNDQQKVSWIISGVYDKESILLMVESLLDLNGVAIVQNGNSFAITSKKQGVAQTAEQGLTSEPTQTTGVWRLQHLDGKDVMTIAHQFLANPDHVQMVENANTVIATGSGPEILSLDKFLGDIDVPALLDRNILIYGPKFLSAAAIVSLLQNFPKAMGIFTSDGKESVEAEAMTNIQRVVIITKGAETRKAVLDYLEQIDKPGKDIRQVFITLLRTQKAKDIRETLDKMLTSMFTDRDKVNIVDDTGTNSLLITATPDEFFAIKKVIDKLDFTAPSVLIESSIIEVQLGESMAYGVEWFLSGHNKEASGNITTSLRSAAIPLTAPLTAGWATAGSTIGLLSLKENAVAALDLLATETSIQVLARPRVLVKNKMTAEIKSTKEVRQLKAELPSNFSSSGTTQIFNQYESKEIGVTLNVTPEVGSDGSVLLKIKIEDSNQGPSEGGQPTYEKRVIDTSFVVSHGETVFIGGLIKRRNSQGTSKVPGLSDIPIIGSAFSNNSATEFGSELIVLVTPYIIMDQYNARLVSEAFAGLKEHN